MRLSDNYQHKSSIVTRGLTFFGSFVLAFVAAGLFSPLIVSNASDSSSSIAVSIEPFIAVSQSSDTISLNTTPSATGTFSSGSNTYSISTNNSTGYTMSVTDLDTDTNLTNIANSEYNIPTLEETTGLSLDNFTINHWGLSSNYDSTNNTGTFYPIPASSGTAYIVSTDAPSEDNINLTLATKIDNTKSSGLYTDDIVVSVVTNTAPTYHKVFGGITTMQEMTSEICAAENTPSKEATALSPDVYPNGWILTGDTNTVTQATLTDTRDGKTYVVRKLANGTCWMSQNLDLDLVANEPIEAYDFSTNTTFNFTPENTTQTETGITWTQTGTEGARSFDNGNKYCIGDTGNQDCTATSSTDPTDHIGNYYNWYAATAGTGTSTSTNTVVQGSICPKGWRLPANTPSDTKSFANLFSSYGLPSSFTSTSDDNIDSPSIKVEKSPLSFLRSGYYGYSDGQLSSQGTLGTYWSSMSYSTATYAYDLRFYATGFGPQYGYTKGYGFSVRCVAV